MTLRVDERGPAHEREITIAILVVPGQPLLRHNHSGPGDPVVTRAQLVTVHTRIVLQLGSIYRPFAIEDDGVLITYSFRILVNVTDEPTPVRRGTPDMARRRWVEDTTDEEHTRSHLAALREARMPDCSNLVVVYPFFAGFATDACAPRVDTTGLRMPQDSAVHRGLQTEASNVVWIGLNMLDPDNDEARGTAGHEGGHFLRLASRHRMDGGIMGRRSAALRRLGEQDQQLIHLAMETRIPGATLGLSVRPISHSPRPHRHVRVQRGR